jgi:ribosome-binding factor A
MKKSQRQLQIGENIKRILADIFLRNDISTAKNCYITITEADISPDAKNAKIYIDIFHLTQKNETDHNESYFAKIEKEIIKQLNQMAPVFRHQLAQKIELRMVPEINFLIDKSQNNLENIEKIIAEEKIKSKLNN